MAAIATLECGHELRMSATEAEEGIETTCRVCKTAKKIVKIVIHE